MRLSIHNFGQTFVKCLCFCVFSGSVACGIHPVRWQQDRPDSPVSRTIGAILEMVETKNPRGLHDMDMTVMAKALLAAANDLSRAFKTVDPTSQLRNIGHYHQSSGPWYA
ncbi:hypothetical protein B0I35DRAFT_51533 [Stachybotrys elegans]|uniref:Uncharacterized protein n=1 Tax=Stachybotrys elegans TaxID=80388 RepID=A0A8K0WQ47_9HYPO|nr:hypothetical protein B0I35DRAFT_51533 [Stachybotrys elegans]